MEEHIQKYEIIVIDDQELIIQSFQLALDQIDGIKVHGHSEPEKILKSFEKNPFRYAAIYIDHHLGDIKGTDLAKRIKSINSLVDVRLISGDNSEEAINAYLEADLDGYYLKPLDFSQKIIPDLMNTMKRYDKTQRVMTSAEAKTDGLIYRKTGLVGSSIKLKRLAEEIFRTAEESSEVLINGESGTGKEVVASAIHANSSRQKEPFIAVNCAAFTSSMPESEIFGHKKGAFTGASTDSVGKIEAAGCGTLFLDEIGEMPLLLQAKLLRVLENKEYFPVGSSTPKQVKARIVAATNRDLRKEVTARNFREDLYYRLNVFQITVPSLRDRKSDVRKLTLHFLNLYKIREQTSMSILEESLQMLEDFDWPGNVRDLRNTIWRACANAKRDNYIIEPKHLDSKFYNTSSSEAPALSVTKLSIFEDRIDEQRKRLLRSAFLASGGNKRGAAELLGIPESTFRNQMKKYNIGNSIGNTN